MIQPIVKRCAGLDIHKSVVVCTILLEQEDGSIQKMTRQYATFRSNLEKLAQWLVSQDVELCTMESTGVYWKSVYESLEDVGLGIFVVNAHHVKNVPGRKTDVADSEWLAELTRCGLLQASFIPPRDLRELRLLTRYRMKVSGMLSAEKNRLHKILDDGGIRLSAVVSDINGVSSKKIIRALIKDDKELDEIVAMALGKLRKKQKELLLALDGRLSDRHRFMLKKIQSHITWLESQLLEIDGQIVAAMMPYKQEWDLLQTIPGISEISAVLLLAEIGVDMGQFGNRKRLSKWIGLCPGNNESAGKKKVAGSKKGTLMRRKSFVK